jgi:hypothetical protein
MAEVLAEELEIVTGIKPAILHNTGSSVPGAGDISLEFQSVTGIFAANEDQEDQSYSVVVSDSVVIGSQYAKGVSYGTSTLIQSIVEASGSYSIPKMTIQDSPVSSYRGIMVDLARKPSSLGTVREVVRMARLYKIRYLHLHLTDDQHFTFPFTPVTSALSGNITYSRSDLEDLAEYADARGVTIVPELDLPGHSARVIESGYLSPNGTHGAVAHPDNYTKVQAIIDDMLSVFPNSPYFHIGGDESSAGSALVPFIEAMNNHLRGKPTGQKKRLLVWEGFHGSPTTQIPATGDDRVIVMSWESSYNTPWNLLNSGYEIINCSWKPMYLAGSGGINRAPHNRQMAWSAETIHSWDKNTFTHWEPGRPVFDDAGPSDPNKSDGRWNASYIDKEDQVLGGQLLSWEQSEKTITKDLLARVPITADRLWNPNFEESYLTFRSRHSAIEERITSIVQPIEILPLSATPNAPYTGDYNYYSGSNVQITLRNRTKIPGTIRYNLGTFTNQLQASGFSDIGETSGSSNAYSAPFASPNGGFGVRARLHRSSGTPVEGHTLANFNNWANIIAVKEFNVPRRPLSSVPDFASFTSAEVKRSYSQPIMRGPYVTDEVRGQMFRATLQAPGSGSYTLRVQTGGGRASVYIDLNRNGIWEDSERVLKDAQGTAVDATVTLDNDPYRFRVDHASDAVSPILIVSLNGPGTSGLKEITPYLSAPEAESSSLPAVPTLIYPPEDEAGVISGSAFTWSSYLADDYRIFIWPKGTAKPFVPTMGGLTTNAFRPTLLPGVTYRWTVVARNGNGQVETPIREFTTYDSTNLESIGWNFDRGNGTNDTVSSVETAGIPIFEQQNWNNHAGSGQGVGSVPFSLVDNSGAASGAKVTAWTLSSSNSWSHVYAGSDPNGKLMNAFNNKNPSITFSDIPLSYQEGGYFVVVYYGNSGGPATSILTVQGSIDDLKTRTIRTGNTAQSAHHNVGYIEADGVNLGISNYTIFGGLDDPEFTVSLANDNINGICAIQIVKIGLPPAPPSSGMIGWNYDNGSVTGDTVGATETAGAPGYEQENWNNHAGVGQGPGSTPFALNDHTGAPSGVEVTSWTMGTNNGWRHAYTGTDPDGMLMKAFANRNPSLTFSGIPAGYQAGAGYSVVVYYGNDNGPVNSILTITGSVDDTRTRTIRTGNTLQSAYHEVGYIEGTDTVGTPTNYTVFTDLNDPAFTVDLTNANNNGICAVQIVKTGGVETSNLIEPGPATTYNPFFAGDWTTGGFSKELYPWTGEEITFLTVSDALDVETMSSLVSFLDAGWALYRDFTGRSPGIGQRINGKPVIAAVPPGAPSCGIGCGIVGSEGIETSGFYSNHYDRLLADPADVAHLYFYEMGRNYYTFGNKHENFATGFAVFMRYVCVDKLGVNDPETTVRANIEAAIDDYEVSAP